jgi:hypothetical protein
MNNVSMHDRNPYELSSLASLGMTKSCELRLESELARRD